MLTGSRCWVQPQTPSVAVVTHGQSQRSFRVCRLPICSSSNNTFSKVSHVILIIGLDHCCLTPSQRSYQGDIIIGSFGIDIMYLIWAQYVIYRYCQCNPHEISLVLKILFLEMCKMLIVSLKLVLNYISLFDV